MNRILVLIAIILFGLGSITGPTMAANVASGHFWSVAESDVCLEPSSTHAEAAELRPCSKKLNGHAVFCPQAAAILPLLAKGMIASIPADFVRLADDAVVDPADGRYFRPPRMA